MLFQKFLETHTSYHIFTRYFYPLCIISEQWMIYFLCLQHTERLNILSAVNYCHKKALSWMFDWILSACNSDAKWELRLEIKEECKVFWVNILCFLQTNWYLCDKINTWSEFFQELLPWTALVFVGNEGGIKGLLCKIINILLTY